MHLWTEYEGRTIAGAYTLGRLLRSEGRNGFFATSDNTGHSAVIRLTEAHYDEDEQLKRWSQVAEVHQDNLIEIEQVGKTTFEGVPLTYALMEPDDANLGDVLKERPLTVAETTQVAKSVVAALSALHGNGLVHEHVESANVLAVGEVVKLRSDCIRECVADIEFNTPEGCAELRRRDIHDLGVLLLQCLTLEKEWTQATNVPEPFSRLIPRALDGSWTLDQIAAFLDPTASIKRSSPAANGSVAPSTAVPMTVPARSPSGAARNGTTAKPVLERTNTVAQPGTPVRPLANDAAASVPLRARQRTEISEASAPSMNKIWAVCISSAVVLVLLLWHFLGSKPAAPATTAPTATVPAASAPAAPVAAAPQPAAPRARPPAAPVADTAPETPTAAAAGRGWYVIAWTYNHQGQAQAKADRINRRSGLHAQVFSPSGHAPYLIALGGPMSEQEASALQHRARRSGMPRDTFIRKY